MTSAMRVRCGVALEAAHPQHPPNRRPAHGAMDAFGKEAI
jgi:hypothetical protein